MAWLTIQGRLWNSIQTTDWPFTGETRCVHHDEDAAHTHILSIKQCRGARERVVLVGRYDIHTVCPIITKF